MIGPTFNLSKGEQLLISQETTFFHLLANFEIEANNQVHLNGFYGKLELVNLVPEIANNKAIRLNYYLKVILLDVLINNKYISIGLYKEK